MRLRTFPVLILILCLALAPSARAQPVVASMAAARTYTIEHEAEILAELRDLLTLPNVAANANDIQRNADTLVALLARRGIAARVLETPDAPPSVFGELRSPGATRTVLFYAHFDGQPVGQQDLWATPPFQPTLRAGRLEDGAAVIPWDQAHYPLGEETRIYARSASDDKSPIIAMLTALDALRTVGDAPSVNLKFFLEGEEEAGSPNLSRILAAHRNALQSDLWIFGDGPIDPRGIPRVLLGVRGVASFRMTVFGPAYSLHSGHYGNVAVNPGAALAHLIASMRAQDGRILIDGFERSSRTPTRQMRSLAREAFDTEGMLAGPGLAAVEAGGSYGEAIMRPALNVTQMSYGGSGAARNAIDPDASAAFDIRLAPGVTPEMARAFVERHLRRQGYTLVDEAPSAEQRRRSIRLARVDWGDLGYSAAMSSPVHPGVARVIEVMRAATDNEVRVAPMLGGSLPIAPIGDILGVPFVIVPIVNADNNQHAPNENVRMREFRRGVELYAALLAGVTW